MAQLGLVFVSMGAGIVFTSQRSATPCLRSKAQLIVRQFTDLAHDLDFGIRFKITLPRARWLSCDASPYLPWR